MVAGCPAFSYANDFDFWYTNIETFVLGFPDLCSLPPQPQKVQLIGDLFSLCLEGLTEPSSLVSMPLIFLINIYILCKGFLIY